MSAPYTPALPLSAFPDRLVQSEQSEDYIADANGNTVASGIRFGYAARIVHACNNFDALATERANAIASAHDATLRAQRLHEEKAALVAALEKAERALAAARNDQSEIERWMRSNLGCLVVAIIILAIIVHYI